MRKDQNTFKRWDTTALYSWFAHAEVLSQKLPSFKSWICHHGRFEVTKGSEAKWLILLWSWGAEGAAVMYVRTFLQYWVQWNLQVRHFGTNHSVHCRENVLFSKLYPYDLERLSLFQRVFYQRFHCTAIFNFKWYYSLSYKNANIEHTILWAAVFSCSDLGMTINHLFTPLPSVPTGCSVYIVDGEDRGHREVVFVEGGLLQWGETKYERPSALL